MREKRHLLPEALQKWDIIDFMDDDEPKSGDSEVMLASKGINLNVLSLDEKRVVINEQATNTIRKLERSGFDPIPVRLRHSRIYSGAFHCSSLDIRRDEELEDYF